MLIKKIKRLNSFKESPECQPFTAGTVVKGQAGRQPGKLSEPSGLSASLLVVLSPFRTEVHEAARVEQRCLENTGIAFDNAAW